MKFIMDNTLSARFREVEGKVKSLRAEMENKNWDAVYISKSEHFAWVTAGGDNIVTRFVEGGICGILITADERYFICNNIETPRMLDEEYLDKLGFKELSMQWYETKTMEIIRGVVGTGLLAADIPLTGSVDCNVALLEMEKVLTDNEIGRYLHMGDVFSQVIEDYMMTIRPGESEKEIAGRLGARMWENGLEPVLYLVAADDRIYKYRHPVPTEKRVDKFLMVSCNARYKGLVTKITRMMYFGKLPMELKEQYAKTVEIENLMAAATKPGTDDLQVLNLAKELYAKAGCPDMWKLHHQGGPQSYTNGFYLISENAHGIVKQNMIYGYNPSITGTKTEDAFAVTAEGPLFMTNPVIFPAIKSEIEGVKYSRPGILEVN